MTHGGVDRRPSFSGYYERPLYRALFRWIDHRKEHVIREHMTRLPSDAVLLDVGCGSGRILARVRRSGDTAIATDHDPRLLRVAQHRGLLGLRFDFDTALPIAGESIDLALMIDAIEHTADPRLAIGELHRILRPGGIAIIFTPPYDSVRWILAERFHHLLTRRPADHISPFTDESFKWMIARRFTRFCVGRVNANLSMYAVATKD